MYASHPCQVRPCIRLALFIILWNSYSYATVNSRLVKKRNLVVHRQSSINYALHNHLWRSNKHRRVPKSKQRIVILAGPHKTASSSVQRNIYTVVGTSEWISPFWFIRHHHHQMHLPITFAGNQNEMTHIGVDKHKSTSWHKQCHKIHLWFLIQIIWKPRPGWHHMTRCVSPEVGWRNPRHFPDFPAIRWRLKNEEHSNHDHLATCIMIMNKCQKHTSARKLVQYINIK